ncbi:meiotic nuclear division protein 1 [Suillus decipiens]|nr:meiotic nuclear division protein 1 [Suillus decipiens]
MQHFQAPRGLSLEEKRTKLLEIFHESANFYQLKELEKLGPKLKGIVSQTVKEVLQSLVDDGLVQGDKIGASNFFWSFPSQRGTIVQNRLDNLKETRTSHEAQLAELKTALEYERTLRPLSDSRAAALEQLTSMKQQLAVLQEEIDAYGACDPVKVEEKRRAVTLAHEAAVRWTDNYSILLSHFTRQTGMDAQDIRKYLEIGEDYEDIF